MQEYSPFLSAKGKRKNLSAIRYYDLNKLQENSVEEGYAVEYKSQWNKEFKNKNLCQTITSFANSEGGWLFVGVNDDGTICGIEKERSDFSQTISQCLNNHVSPIPSFECRFVKEHSTNNSGVLVIYVPKGQNTPYICNGTVYIRNGSSKLPIKSGRSEIDNLYKRQEKLSEEINKFCVCDTIDKDQEYPYLSIFLYSNSFIPNTISREKIEKLASLEIASILRVNHCMDSVIFYNTDSVSKNAVTWSIEIFTSGFAKLIIPLMQATVEENDNLLDFFSNMNSKINIDDFLGIDAYSSTNTTSDALSTAFAILEKTGVHIKNYNFSYEINNIKNTFLYFPYTEKDYFEFILLNKFRFSTKKVQKSLVCTFNNSKNWKALSKNSLGYAMAIISSTFGFSYFEFRDLFLKTCGNYPRNIAIEKQISRISGGRIVNID